MVKKKKHRFLKAIVCILILCVIIGVVAIVKNQMGAELKQLNEADQAILTEYNTLCASLEEKEIWEGYNLEDEYHILNSMQSQLISENSDKNTLEQAARDYVDIMDKRLAANNEYVQQELEIETDEGTANYVGIQAYRRVGYDFGVMYFTNQKNVPFDDIITQYQAGNIDKSSLANRVPYETVALLCLVMDEIGVDDWQDSLNSQTKDNYVTLYSILKEWVD